ncbi:MAG: hypothetical protein IJ833_01920 [Lachnospiraceae bacterium]|nr:hypothetical protein [Lachnospiraceae bacterium]
MYQLTYAKEPFDLKLFVYHCARRWKLFCLGALLGLALIGGGYFLMKVVLAEPAAYQVIDKYYVEYGTDPQIQLSYSYFAGYTWSDWVQSDEWVKPVLEQLSFPMTKEELVNCVSAELRSDVRIPYLVITHPDAQKALEIAEVYRESMFAFGKSQKELVEIRLLDTEGPAPVARDIRCVRACVLGLVVGAFVAWFLVGFFYLLDEKIYLPETCTYRYGIPTAGYLNREGGVSVDLADNLKFLLDGKEKLGVTAVDGGMDLQKTVEQLSGAGMVRESLCVADALHAHKLGALRETDGNLLFVRAGADGGKAVEATLHRLALQEVTVTAIVLTDVDERLLSFYRWK